MRVTGGEWRGRILAVPKSPDVRPTQDRVREALFSILMNEVPGARFLDLFAGSGAVGLDALSRGAVSATFVECDRRHLECLRANAASLNGAAAKCEIVQADAYQWIDSAGAGRLYDVAFADPPYALGAERGSADVLEALARGDVVRPGGLFVVESAVSQKAGEHALWDLCRDREYGKTRLAVYKRKAS